MSDNEKAMTLEDRIVQSLKDETLYKLVGDEDAITELVKRAINEALYQPQRIKVDNYGRYETKDSVVVEAARGIARKAADEAVGQLVKQILADETIVTLIRRGILEILPAVITGSLHYNFQSQLNMAVTTSVDSLKKQLVDQGMSIKFGD
jgi:hypothetical protein